MSFPLYFYNLLLNTFGLGSLLFFRSQAMSDKLFFDGRLGSYPNTLKAGSHPRIWFHAASVGEVTGISPTLKLLRARIPGATLWLTVGTLHGFRFAQKQVGNSAQVLPFPLDFPWALSKALSHLQPDVYVATESEFWPNLFQYLHRLRVPTLLLNGRLTDRSTKRYSMLRPIFQPIFNQFQWLAMHSPEDMHNALLLGAPRERTMVLGTAKYDGLSMRVNPESTERWRALLNLPSSAPIIVGGSLRGCECKALLEVFQRLQQTAPDALGIFVPRHLERVPEMAGWLEQRNIQFHLLSRIEGSHEKREASVVIVDRIGVLFELYALGDLIFCGGTIEPVGGHNILEPAAWGKPVFYGPHIGKVYHEHRHLEAASGSFLLQNTGELLEKWTHWVQHLDELRPHGERAREAVRKLEGVAARQVDLIIRTLREAGFEVD